MERTPWSAPRASPGRAERRRLQARQVLHEIFTGLDRQQSPKFTCLPHLPGQGTPSIIARDAAFFPLRGKSCFGALVPPPPTANRYLGIREPSNRTRGRSCAAMTALDAQSGGSKSKFSTQSDDRGIA